MKALEHKLLRNLVSLRAQGLAIALVIASGVATFVMAHAALDSLRLTRSTVYETQRFAEVFAELERAPDSLAARLRELPGVAMVETRIRAPVRLRIEGFDDPVTGIAISIPDGTQPQLNRLHLVAGRMPAADRADEVLINEAFAGAHRLQPGDRIGLVVNGRLQSMAIAGLALSPEFIYQIRPGDLFPDFARHAIVWMNHGALAPAFGMRGAFNSLALTLAPGADERSIIDSLDLLLQRWGSLGAYSRADQLSHRYLEQELQQLEAMATVLPLIFIGVAAFLLHIVSGRLVRTQREQIGVLKAFGYGRLRIATHYLGLVMVAVAIGSLLGVIAGAWLAQVLGGIYQEFFRFPWLEFRLRASTAAIAAGIAGGATLAGAFAAARSAWRLPPAAAMQPEAPARFRRTRLERLGLGALLSQPSRMILRNLERRALRSTLSVLGIALAVAILVVTGFQQTAITHMTDVQFRLAHRQDLTVNLVGATSMSALGELAALPGVRHVEGVRAVPVVLRAGARDYRTTLVGFPAESRLTSLLDDRLEPVALPSGGLTMTDHLATLLGVAPGDRLEVIVREGRAPTLSIEVARRVTEYVGVAAYLPLDELNQLLQEGPTVNGARLAADPMAGESLQSAIEGLPRVSGVSLRDRMIESLRELMDESVLVFTLYATALAGCLAFAVVYNNARIALAERNRELATLRVLGFTRAETAWVLLGELLVLTLAALAPGYAIGVALTWLLTTAMQTDLYRVPMVLESATFARATLVVLGATMLSSLLLANRLRRLDMVASLKAPD